MKTEEKYVPVTREDAESIMEEVQKVLTSHNVIMKPVLSSTVDGIVPALTFIKKDDSNKGEGSDTEAKTEKTSEGTHSESATGQATE